VNFASFFQWWCQQASEFKTNLNTLISAMRHPGTPWYARLFVALIIAYVVSPIDLIPDFIPIFGYLDDLLLIPVGLYIAGTLIPSWVWRECSLRPRNTPIPRSLYFFRNRPCPLLLARNSLFSDLLAVLKASTRYFLCVLAKFFVLSIKVLRQKTGNHSGYDDVFIVANQKTS